MQHPARAFLCCYCVFTFSYKHRNRSPLPLPQRAHIDSTQTGEWCRDVFYVEPLLLTEINRHAIGVAEEEHWTPLYNVGVYRLSEGAQTIERRKGYRIDLLRVSPEMCSERNEYRNLAKQAISESPMRLFLILRFSSDIESSSASSPHVPCSHRREEEPLEQSRNALDLCQILQSVPQRKVLMKAR